MLEKMEHGPHWISNDADAGKSGLRSKQEVGEWKRYAGWLCQILVLSRKALDGRCPCEGGTGGELRSLLSHQ